ncbi:MAG: hypothetical protein WC631_01755 [Candidatus Paceibacterota bacterium]|jgi:hypothetical protein
MWQELIKKIELQSILVLFITLLAGCWLLNGANNFTSPRGILGTISISVGLLYTIISFFSNQIRESYKDVISEYKSTIGTLRSSSKDIEKSYQALSSQGKDRVIGGNYQTISEAEVGTNDS